MVKFDVVIGNPPYNHNVSGDNGSYQGPVYPDFMDASATIGDKVSMITPGRFLFNAGATSKIWNRKMLSDKHFKVILYESDSSAIFDNVNITGGVAITYWDKGKVFGEIGTFIPIKPLSGIFDKVVTSKFDSIYDNIKNQYNFILDELFAVDDNIKKLIGSGGRDKRIRSNALDLIPVFTTDKVSDDDIKVFGLYDRQRTERYIDKTLVDYEYRMGQYEVLVPAANGSGSLGEVDCTPIIGIPTIIAPNAAHTQTFISIGSFDYEAEAEACLKYIKSKFARSLLGILKVTQSTAPSTFKYVPLQDFTEDSDIDWSKTIPEIDQQLYKKYGLNEEEINFIESNIKEMD